MQEIQASQEEIEQALLWRARELVRISEEELLPLVGIEQAGPAFSDSLIRSWREDPQVLRETIALYRKYGSAKQAQEQSLER